MDILSDILACASVWLDSTYPDYPIFTEYVPNELPKRCFLLSYAGDVSINHSLGSRYEVSGKLDIAYIAPKRSDVSVQENNAVFVQLSLGMRHISFGKTRIRLGSHTRHDVDDVMHDICSFKTFLYNINDTPYMGKLNISPQIKE